MRRVRLNLSNRFGIINPATGTREHHGPGDRLYPEHVAGSLGLTPLEVVDDPEPVPATEASRDDSTAPNPAPLERAPVAPEPEREALPAGWPSDRIHATLEAAGLDLTDLRGMSAEQLTSVRGIGEASAREILKRLASL